MAGDEILLNRIATQPSSVLFERVQQHVASARTSQANKAREASREFEALLITQMLQVMRQTVPDGELFEQDAGRDTYFQLLDVELGREISRSGAVGLADMLYRQLQRKLDPSTGSQSDQ
jgi:flagellar protein FlgJ